MTDRLAVRVKRMVDDQIEVARLVKLVMRPNENGMDVNYHVFIRSKATGLVMESREPHHIRYLFQSEVELLLAWRNSPLGMRARS